MRQPTKHAQAAKLIRKELKKTFPATTFRVTCRLGTQTTAITLSWEDGPSLQDVRPLVRPYESGDFNGREDIYEYSNRNHSIPQVEFIFLNRDCGVKQFIFEGVKP